MRSALIVPYRCSPRSEQDRGKECALKIVLFGLVCVGNVFAECLRRHLGSSGFLSLLRASVFQEVW
jgi:hypothetical protein